MSICAHVGAQATGHISGVNFNDLTGDGITPDDARLGAFTIEVFRDDGDGSFTALDPLAASALTDAITGAYSISNLADGRYFVRQVPVAGYTQTVGLPHYEIQVDDGQVFVGQQLIIDDFLAPAPLANFQASTTVSNIIIKTPDASILGGERDLQVLVNGPPQFLSALGGIGQGPVKSTYQLATFGDPGTGTRFQYDGLDADAVGNLVNAGSLGGVDLTGNGASSGIRLRFERLEAGAPGAVDLDIEVRATSTNGATATFTDLIVQDITAFSIFTPFTMFTTGPGFDWTQIASLEVLINQRSITDIDIELDLLSSAFLGGGEINFANFAEPSSLSGFVFAERVKDCNRQGTEQPIPNVPMTLMGVDDLGATVLLTTQTDTNGFYAFTNLRPGTYKINETQPAAYVDGPECAGSLGAVVTDDQQADIPLPAGANGIEYNFCEQLTVDLGLTKTSLPTVVSGGDTFSYELTVTNLGPSLATGVTITDLLPTGLQLVSASLSCDTNSLPQIVCDAGALAPGQSQSLTLTVMADCCAGSVVNTAGVFAAEVEITLTNNTALASTTINPDVEAPVFVTCPSNVTLACNATLPAADIALAVASDNCSTPTVTHVGDVINASSCLTVVTRTYRATDACGNTADCVHTISIPTDVVDPVITACPTDLVLPCNTPAAPAADTNLVRATDNCGLVTVTHEGDVTNAMGCLTVITRTYRATDPCGNFVDCTHTISIPTDAVPPVLVGVPADTIVSCEAVPVAAVVTVMDNCSTNLVATFNEQRINGSCTGTYMLVRSWSAVDDCGNPVAATQTITVQDLTPPVIVCPAGFSIMDCSASGVVPDLVSQTTATDNCSGATITQSPAAGSAFTGTVTITLTATDACGNAATCQVTISDYAKIGDFVWVDTNGNGIQEAGEPGLDGVTVNLLDANQQLVDSAITVSNGMYMFCVQPGAYCVQVVTNTLPAHHCFTRKGVGDPLTNSDANPNGFTDKFVVGPGEVQPTVDIGVFPSGCIDGSIWTDAAQQGVTNGVNLAVLGMAGIRVDICRVESNGVEVLYTSATSFALPGNAGYFVADKVPVGTYKVKVDTSTLPANIIRFTTAPTQVVVVPLGACGPAFFGVLPQPTYIELNDFSATVSAAGVSVNWATDYERDNLGFQVYRSRTMNGARVPVGGFMPAIAVGAGASYSLLDQAGEGTWFYWLEDIDFWEKTTIHGPLRVRIAPVAPPVVEPVDVVASPVAGAVKILASDGGVLSFTTETDYPNYLVTGLGEDPDILDQTDQQPLRLIGYLLSIEGERAVYFSAEPGRSIEVR